MIKKKITTGGNRTSGGLEITWHFPTSAKVQIFFQSDKRRTCVGELAGLGGILAIFLYVLTALRPQAVNVIYVFLSLIRCGGMGVQPPHKPNKPQGAGVGPNPYHHKS